MGRFAAVAVAALLTFADTGAAQDLVLHKEGTSLYHRPWCEVVRDGRGVLALSRGQANGRGLKPHAECDREPPQQSPVTSDEARAGDKAPVYVFVDAGKHYHREGCAKLGRTPRKVALAEAGRKLWPCPACKPPIRKRGPRSTTVQHGHE